MSVINEQKQFYQKIKQVLLDPLKRRSILIVVATKTCENTPFCFVMSVCPPTLLVTIIQQQQDTLCEDLMRFCVRTWLREESPRGESSRASRRRNPAEDMITRQTSRSRKGHWLQIILTWLILFTIVKRYILANMPTFPNLCSLGDVGIPGRLCSEGFSLVFLSHFRKISRAPLEGGHGQYTRNNKQIYSCNQCICYYSVLHSASFGYV
jgi:hypothetical protein